MLLLIRSRDNNSSSSIDSTSTNEIILPLTNTWMQKGINFNYIVIDAKKALIVIVILGYFAMLLKKNQVMITLQQYYYY